jgi:hypothetical protein
MRMSFEVGEQFGLADGCGSDFAYNDSGCVICEDSGLLYRGAAGVSKR